MWLQRKQNAYKNLSLPFSLCAGAKFRLLQPALWSKLAIYFPSQLTRTIPFWFFTFPTGIQTSLIVANIYLARPFLFRSGYFSAGDRAHCCSTALFAALARQKVAGKLHWNSESDSPTEVLRNRCKMCKVAKSNWLKVGNSSHWEQCQGVPSPAVNYHPWGRIRVGKKTGIIPGPLDVKYILTEYLVSFLYYHIVSGHFWIKISYIDEIMVQTQQFHIVPCQMFNRNELRNHFRLQVFCKDPVPTLFQARLLCHRKSGCKWLASTCKISTCALADVHRICNYELWHFGHQARCLQFRTFLTFLRLFELFEFFQLFQLS